MEPGQIVQVMTWKNSFVLGEDVEKCSKTFLEVNKQGQSDDNTFVQQMLRNIAQYPQVHEERRKMFHVSLTELTNFDV